MYTGGEKAGGGAPQPLREALREISLHSHFLCHPWKNAKSSSPSHRLPGAKGLSVRRGSLTLAIKKVVVPVLKPGKLKI